MKKGFTLVELLAVIVILAVILVIAVPRLNDVIRKARINTIGSTAKLIAAKAEEKEVENQALETNEALSCSDLVKLDNNYGSCTVEKVEGKWIVTLSGSSTGKFEGITCIGTKSDINCNDTKGNSKLTIDLDSGTSTQNFNEYYEPNTTITLIAPTKEGFDFKEWMVINGNATLNGNVLTIGTENTTIKALYEIDHHTTTIAYVGPFYGSESGEGSTGVLADCSSTISNWISGMISNSSVNLIEFRRNTSLTEEEVVAKGATRIDNHPDEDTYYKIYGWAENGIIYWWSNLDKVYMNNDNIHMFTLLTIDGQVLYDDDSWVELGRTMKTIDLSGFDTSLVTDMSDLFTGVQNEDFYDENAVETIILSEIDTSNVTNMSCMFCGLRSMSSINLSNFDTSNVVNMHNMFFEFGADITAFSLNLSSFDTSKVTDMSDMFLYAGIRASTWSITIPRTNRNNVNNTTSRMYGNSTSTYVDVSSTGSSNRSFTLAN